MFTVPATPAGDVAVIEASVFIMKIAAFVPNFTPVTPMKFVPVIVTEVPPSAGPKFGETLVMVGSKKLKEDWMMVFDPSYRCHTAVALPLPSTTI